MLVALLLTLNRKIHCLLATAPERAIFLEGLMDLPFYGRTVGQWVPKIV